MWAKIVLNLLSNALKFTFDGTIAVRVDHDDAFARLEVSDTGVGIAPADQARLFERFHRVVGARARTHEGSGIGLALVAELAQLHGGRAEVQSAPGVGSTFTVAVPFGREHLPPEQLTDEPRPVSVEREAADFLAEASRWTPVGVRSAERGASRFGRRSRSMTDGRACWLSTTTQTCASTCRRSCRMTYSVQTAPDGEAALALARADAPDLVLSDVMMPRLDGFGLLAALRDDPATMQIPVVMLSARAGQEGVVEGLDAGADDYLVKPFSARELLARVRANLELERARRIRDQLERSQAMQDQAERLADVGSWELDLSTGSRRSSEQLRRMLGNDRVGP